MTGNCEPCRLRSNGQGATPVDLALEAALPGLATAPATVELHAFASNQRLHVQAFKADGQFRAGDFAAHQVDVAVDLRREQATGDTAVAVELAVEGFHHRHKRPRHRQIQPGEAEIAGDRLVFRQRIDLRLQPQLTELAALEVQLGVDALGVEGGFQLAGCRRGNPATGPCP